MVLMKQKGSDKWKEEIEIEHKRIYTNGVQKCLDKKIPEGAKVITSAWACKKKRQYIPWSTECQGI